MSWSAAVAADASGDSLSVVIQLYRAALPQLSQPRLATATARLLILHQLHTDEESLRAKILAL
jgi:hypothetical protein